VQRY
jgi:ribosome assembly protein 4